MSIHTRIKQRRKALQLTMAQFSKAVGLTSYQAISQWETEGGTAPTRSRMPKVAQALGVTEEWLRTGHDDKDSLTATQKLWLDILDDLGTDDIREFLSLIGTRQERNRKLLRDIAPEQAKGRTTMRPAAGMDYLSPDEASILENYRAATEIGKELIKESAGHSRTHANGDAHGKTHRQG